MLESLPNIDGYKLASPPESRSYRAACDEADRADDLLTELLEGIAELKDAPIGNVRVDGDVTDDKPVVHVQIKLKNVAASGVFDVRIELANRLQELSYLIRNSRTEPRR